MYQNDEYQNNNNLNQPPDRSPNRSSRSPGRRNTEFSRGKRRLGPNDHRNRTNTQNLRVVNEVKRTPDTKARLQKLRNTSKRGRYRTMPNIFQPEDGGDAIVLSPTNSEKEQHGYSTPQVKT
eukprot:UN02062